MAHEGVERFLGWRQVKDLTGLGRTTAWRMRQTGDFPEPVPISPGRVAWRERDIAAWNESRGAPVPIRSSVVVCVTVRRHEERKVPPVAKPRTTLTDVSPSDRPSKPLGRKRRAVPVAEGQLGFDF